MYKKQFPKRQPFKKKRSDQQGEYLKKRSKEIIEENVDDISKSLVKLSKKSPINPKDVVTENFKKFEDQIVKKDKKGEGKMVKRLAGILLGILYLSLKNVNLLLPVSKAYNNAYQELKKEYNKPTKEQGPKPKFSFSILGNLLLIINKYIGLVKGMGKLEGLDYSLSLIHFILEDLPNTIKSAWAIKQQFNYFSTLREVIKKANEAHKNIIEKPVKEFEANQEKNENKRLQEENKKVQKELLNIIKGTVKHHKSEHLKTSKKSHIFDTEGSVIDPDSDDNVSDSSYEDFVSTPVNITFIQGKRSPQKQQSKQQGKGKSFRGKSQGKSFRGKTRR